MATEAMRLHKSGKFSEAELLCRQVLESEPDNFRSIVHLSVLLRHRGDFEESENLAKLAIGIEPDHVDGYTQLGLCLLGTGRSNDAVTALSKAISLSPRLAPLHHNLGMALENLGRSQEAKQAFIHAIKLAPNDVRARLSLGSLLLTEGDLYGANAHADASIRMDRRSGASYLLKAKIQVAEGKGNEAEMSILRSLDLEPDSSFGHTMLGFRRLQMGDFRLAEESFRRSISLDAAQGVAFFGITQARKVSEKDRPLVEQMEGVLNGIALTLDQASYLHYGLANAYDNLGDFGRAMTHYEAAHSSANQYRFGDAPFDPDQYAAEIDAIINLYPAERFVGGEKGFESELPIFIVGMMRSGTTLTEQILSSHPNIGAAGEHEFWAKRGREAENFERGQIYSGQATTLARQYCRDLRKISPGTSRVTDKLPGNYLRLGQIHLALPNAKIIHCRRNPVDTALSIYFTANPLAPKFSHSKSGIVFAYRQYQRLIEHWRMILPSDRFFELDYEELVQNPREVIRQMLLFLELPWSDLCLNHDKNAKEVRTPSLWQVRQPMYSTSIQRWRKYESWLGPLAELFE